MRWLVAIGWLAIPGIASAQPPATSSASAYPQTTSSTTYAEGEQLPKGSWPGVGLEDLRGLPECSLEDPAPRIGEPIECRPPVLPTQAHYSVSLGWSTGLVTGDDSIGGTHAIVLAADWWLTRSLGIGVQGSLAALGASMREPSMSGTGSMSVDHRAIANEALLVARWRAWTDEVDRDGFTLSLGGGYAWRECTGACELGGGMGGGMGGDDGRSALDRNGAVVRAAISRDVGWMFGESSALGWSWELALEQDLGGFFGGSGGSGSGGSGGPGSGGSGGSAGLDGNQGLGYRTLVVGIRTGIERGIREPRNLASRDSDPPFRSAIAGDFRGGPQGVGFGAGMDFSLAQRLQIRATAFWTSRDDGDGDSGMLANWGVEAGPRVLLITSLLQPYVEAQAGPALLAGSTKSLGSARVADQFGALAEAEVGLGIPLFCQSRIDLGFRVQARVDDGFDPTAFFGVFRIAHGTALRQSAGECTPDTPFAR